MDGPAIVAAIVAYGAVRLTRWYAKSRVNHGVCVLDPIASPKVRGHVTLTAKGMQTRFDCDIQGLPKGRHGLHVHRLGDLREGCASACDHYNPDGRPHGGRRGRNRHRGDLGNITAGGDGVCRDVFEADVALHEIIGRSLVIHADADDLGRGGHPDSMTTGHSGDRIACGVIGIA